MPKRVSVNCRCGRSVSVPTDELEGVFTCPHCGRRGHWRSSQGMDGGPSASKVDAAAQTEASSPDTRREATPSTAASTPRQARETAGGAVTDEGTKLPTNPNGATCLYDAFISYRHADTDRFFAERLHRLLEAYRVPRALVRQGIPRRLTRVFRDREELDASENLSDTIKQALSSSRFLIVICSPRTPESIWVKQEIEYFRTLEHGNHILALLIEGEPAESFPPNLTQLKRVAKHADGSLTEIVETVDPLAPDIRASRRSTSLKLLATEKLRLLAPMLGCRFDDLRRREQLRRRRQLIVWTVCLMLFGSVLGGLAWQTHAGWNLARMLDAKASKFEILAAAEETAKKKALDEQAAAENRAAAIAADAKEAELQAAEKIKRSVNDKLSAEERAQQLARASNISENEKRRHAFSSNLDRAEQMIEADPERAASFLKDSSMFPQNLRDFAWGYRLGQADPAVIGSPIVKVVNEVVEGGRDRPSVWLRHFSARHGLVVEPTFKLVFIDPTSGTEIRSIQTGGLYAVDWERGILAKWGTRPSEGNQPATPIVLIENFETGEVLGSLPANSALSGLAMSPDGRLLAGMTTTGLVGLWNLETLSPIGTFFSRGGKLQFSADGKSVMTCDLEIERKPVPLKKGEKPPAPAVQIWPLNSVLTQKKQPAKPVIGPSKPRTNKLLVPLKITARNAHYRVRRLLLIFRPTGRFSSPGLPTV